MEKEKVTFEYADFDTDVQVCRGTVLEAAEKFGLSETEVIHQALAAMLVVRPKEQLVSTLESESRPVV